MFHAPSLQKIKFAVELAIDLAVQHRDPAVHQRREPGVSFSLIPLGMSEVCKDGRDAMRLGEINHTQEHRLDLAGIARAIEGGYGVERDEAWLYARDFAQHDREMHFEAVKSWPRRDVP